ncbi:MAG: ChaN family lipoprotein [Gemmatimonadales bacterium]
MARSTIPGATAGLLLGLLAGCGAGAGGSPGPLPSTVALYDGSTRAPLDQRVLLDRARSADFVLLGEVHDNPVHHETRGRILTALADVGPAVIFEQLRASDGPIPPPPGGQPDNAWLDEHGFDRAGWRWPLHRPVVAAAITHGRSLWGSNLPRESLVGVVRNGESALPPELRTVMSRAPLDSAAQALMDQELIDGHCGQLPASMVGGMRTAQVARDASMARAMMAAAATGPALLIAGNGHVRGDVAVPRILRALAPGKTVLAVGLLETAPAGGLPPDDAWTGYDLVIVTPRIERPDPCAALRRSSR